MVNVRGRQRLRFSIRSKGPAAGASGAAQAERRPDRDDVAPMLLHWSIVGHLDAGRHGIWKGSSMRSLRNRTPRASMHGRRTSPSMVSSRSITTPVGGSRDGVSISGNFFPGYIIKRRLVLNRMSRKLGRESCLFAGEQQSPRCDDSRAMTGFCRPAGRRSAARLFPRRLHPAAADRRQSQLCQTNHPSFNPASMRSDPR